MSWMLKLYETYEKAVTLDLPDEDKLEPVGHILQDTHINIVIDNEGNFRRARVEKLKLILPATEKSAGRTSGKAPHPLADKLQYIAKDYAKYGGSKKAYFDGYMQQLSQWCESDFSHPMAKAVYRYIEKGRVIEDLINSKIVYIDDRGVLLTRWTQEVTEETPIPLLFKILPKENGELDQGSALVCWTVEFEGYQNQNTWTDESLQQSWIEFDASSKTKKGFCFITGKNTALATNHPAKLRGTGDKAKLISANDWDGFTFLGRFTDSKLNFKKNGSLQCVGVGISVSQKAHHALSWLIRKGYRNGDQVIIAWAISGKPVPSALKCTWELFGSDFEKVDILEVNESIHIKDHSHNLGQEFANRLKNKLKGYREVLSDHESIMLMCIDSATLGRMSITYYRETNTEEFFNRLESWYSDFSWPQLQKITAAKNKKITKEDFWSVSSPAPKAIAEAAYGERLKDSLKKNVIERLIPCIVEGRPLPKDLVDNCVRRASNPNAYGKDEKWRWRRDINIACALYKGYCLRKNFKMPDVEKRKFDMSLDRECRNRDYLYGRLLAIAERIEQRALYSQDKNRITNAESLMQRFSFNPAKTWPIIHNHLAPYMKHLQVSKPGTWWYWDQELKEVHNLFNSDDFKSSQPLSGEYLLGYYCQKYYQKSRKTEDGEIINPIGNATNHEEN